MTKATPRPWALYDEGAGDFPKWVVSSETGVVVDNIRHADGEYIVRTANSHDALVEALEELHDYFLVEGACPDDESACTDCKNERLIRNCLALVKGEARP